MIKFQQHYVTDGTTKARVSYHAGTQRDGTVAVTLYARDYSRNLGAIFDSEYKNDTDSQTDYYDEGRVYLPSSHPLYAAALARCEPNAAAYEARTARLNAKRAARRALLAETA